MRNFLALILLSMLSACAVSNAPAGHGFIYTDATEVIYYDPYIKPQQKATLCSTNILGLVSIGDNSFTALKLDSGIRKISTMERTYSSALSLFVKSCLVVKGE